jgi:predicted choloylglycine hydrolase
MHQGVLWAVDEAEPGDRWRELYRQRGVGYRRWFLSEGDAARPSYLACERALRRYMPELLPVWERVTEAAGGGDQAARLLSLWCPPAYLAGCSQAVWSRDPLLLVRNYDYSPRLWDGVLLRSAWLGRPVIAMTDVLWGALDGINDAGLAVALAFGGRKAIGEGFGIPLIMRYILETCATASEAAAVLRRIPSHMSYNVTAVDADGAHITAHVAPDRPTVITHRRIATNHQHAVEWHAYAHATATVDRERFLATRLNDPGETADRFVQRFLEPPLFSTRFDHGWGTLYTAVYRPERREAELRWPNAALPQSVDRFAEAQVHIRYGRDTIARQRRASA